jgi:hypothetical protein
LSARWLRDWLILIVYANGCESQKAIKRKGAKNAKVRKERQKAVRKAEGKGN